MKRILTAFKVGFGIIGIIEMTMVIILLTLYHFNVYNLQGIFDEYAAIILLAVVVAINIGIGWFYILKSAKQRRESDLKAAELIGGDIQEAYNFGMIGLVVVDENNNVIWTNDLFKERKINILDVNILDFEHSLRELQDSNTEKIVKVSINNRNYDVKYLSEARLYIFKDATEYEAMAAYSKEQSIVVGLIIIDNYNDVSSNVDDSNDIVSKVKNIIFDYCKEYGILLTRYRNDSYFAICNFAALEKIKQDEFSLLHKVRELGDKQDAPPTLSIGFAFNFPDIIKLNEMATSALNIAMSRGGDQAVVSRYGEDLKFYGGKVEATEKRSKVKVRVLADSLITTIKNSTNVIIMGHVDADMDSVGSCLGIKAICDHFHKPSFIVYEPKLTEKKARGALVNSFPREELMKMTVTTKEAYDKVKSNTLVVLVDTHRPSISMAPKALEKATKIVVIDHHRRSDEFVEMPVFSYVEPSASSASELVTELIQYATENPKISIPSKSATIMLSGIFLDTNQFRAKSTGIRTFEASMILREFGADTATADDFLKDEFEEYSLINEIITTLKTPHAGIVMCKTKNSQPVEAATLAKVATRCLQMKGVNAAFVIGNVDDNTVKVSSRSDGTINVQLLNEKMGGGGHFASAASSFKGSSIDKVEDILLDVLDTYISAASQN